MQVTETLNYREQIISDASQTQMQTIFRSNSHGAKPHRGTQPQSLQQLDPILHPAQ